MIKLSVVVIGRNEGPFLSNCLQSVKKMNFSQEKMELIYVDSSSEDDSVERAHQCGANVVHLQDCKPTAALARNLGWQIAKGEFILFLDGDTTLDPNFVTKTLSTFNNPQVGVVSGQVKEKHPEKSFYNCALDIDWKMPAGIVEICGGNTLIRREVLQRVNGFNGELIVGEEPELCQRIKAEGYSIVQLDIPMVTHDLDIQSFKEYWVRCTRTGYAYASVSDLTKDTSRPLWKSRARHNFIKALLFFLWFIAGLYYLIKNAQILPLFLLSIAIILLIVRTTQKLRNKNFGWKTSIAYGIHSHFQHIPMFFGQLNFWFSKIK